MATLNQMLDHIAHLPRTGHDVSQSLAFTASTGMLLPIYSDFLNSSETVYITEDLFARTQPLVTAAMADVDVYLDWFYVPMTMLYTPWGQIRWQTTDFVTSYFSESYQLSSGGNQTFLKYTNYYPCFDFGNSFSSMNTSSGPSINIHNGPGILQFLTTPSNSNTQFLSSQFDCLGKSTFRLLDLLGYNPYVIFNDGTNSNNAISMPNTFPWKLLAYQCIYQNWYRNDDLERLQVGCYNIDHVLSVSNPDGSFVWQRPNNRGDAITTLRYADYRKDYFQSAKPSPILSSMSSLFAQTSDEQSIGSVLSEVDSYLSTINGSPILGNSNSGIASVTSPGFGTFSTQSLAQISNSRLGSAQLRSLFAVEKLMRITGRANKTYDAQTLAHFGFKVPHDVKHDITHLRSSHGLLHIGEVIATANTFTGDTGSALGEISGKGYISIHNDKKTKFTAPVDGALMCIFRAIPRQRLIGTYDQQNAIASRTDLYIPEFDKLGMQPLFEYTYNRAYFNTSNFRFWQIRYHQYKQKFDRATQVFDGETANGVNQYSAWVLTRSALFNTGTANQNAIAFKCPPTALNSIMVVPYTTTVDSSTWRNGGNIAANFYTDPFICDFRANVKKVSPMSRTGEPDMVSF